LSAGVKKRKECRRERQRHTLEVVRQKMLKVVIKREQIEVEGDINLKIHRNGRLK
jgi:hypothetical protein